MKVAKVLLIDDNDIDNYVTKQVVSKLNIAENIIIKSSAIDALKYLTELSQNKEHFPEIIFLDIRMPQMDGFEFLEEYKKFDTETAKSCNIYMLSSSSSPEDINRASTNNQIRKYFTKPLQRSMVEEVIIDCNIQL